MICKSLDLNKLFSSQRQGKLLKKHVVFPMLASTKYDGNYVTIEVKGGTPKFTTSGGLNYTHTDDGGAIFNDLPDALYIAERIYGKGLLGDRNKCNLRGSKSAQTSTGHSYKVFDVISLDNVLPFSKRYETLQSLFKPEDIALTEVVNNQDELDLLLRVTVKQGYEGVMAASPNFIWKDTKSRTVDLIKYKGRPTVDLLCIGTTEGTGKYVGVIGSLRLTDSKGRIVDVGSGMSDEDRERPPSYFIGKVIEVFYEQIVDTYIQPTFGSDYEGVLIRDKKDID